MFQQAISFMVIWILLVKLMLQAALDMNTKSSQTFLHYEAINFIFICGQIIVEYVYSSFCVGNRKTVNPNKQINFQEE